MTSRQVDIICTVGPSSALPGVQKAMWKAGMTTIRINMSHASIRDMGYFIEQARKISRKLKVLVDLPGPKIRIGKMYPREVYPGMDIVMTTDPEPPMALVPISYDKLPSLLSKGDNITTDDGRVGLVVKRVKGKEIHCKVLYGKVLKPHKGVNVPFVDEKFPLITRRDQEIIPHIPKNKPEYVATSYVRNAKNVEAIRDALDKAGGKDIKLIAKIENPEAVGDIAGILASKATHGVMVARGDLAYEGRRTDLLPYSLAIISEAKKAGKPVIMATQVISSMARSWVPTRAEMTDMSLAVALGVDGVMTSGETAQGDHPTAVVEVMKEFVDAAKENGQRMRELLKGLI